MIYFDNSATTLQKPPEVAQAVAQAISSLGNAGRSFYPAAMDAARTIYATRSEIARLVQLENPLQVAFTSGATESLNLVIGSLVSAQDHVITTVLEHNSVLRPLYKTGCQLSFIPCDEEGKLVLTALDSFLQPNTRFVVCTHGSNLTGAVTNVNILRKFCQKNHLIFILDVAQTLGAIPTYADMADVLCFTGHKALLGPQGTGGIITSRPLAFTLAKTGGTGSQSFKKHQPLQMPDVFEAGTANGHGLAGLQQSTAYLNTTGAASIQAKEAQLLKAFLAGIQDITTLRLYRSFSIDAPNYLPVVALNIGDRPAEDVALQLWDKYRIATRAGSHCAPLVHQHFKTAAQGMVRFSFSSFNTMQEIEIAVNALRDIAK